MVSPRQLQFIEEFLIDLNATQAAIRAGYSAESARKSYRLLRSPPIRAALADARARQAARLGITADRVVGELARVGTSDIRRLFDAEGRLKPLAALDDAVAGAITSIRIMTRGRPRDDAPTEVDHVVEIRLWDKNTALEKLGKHLGLFRDRLNVTVNGDLAEKIAAARRRVAEQGRK